MLNLKLLFDIIKQKQGMDKMKEEKVDETSKMILLYFMEKAKKLKKQKECLQQEVEELAKINKQITKEG